MDLPLYLRRTGNNINSSLLSSHYISQVAKMMAFTRFTQTVARMVSRAITTADAKLPKHGFIIPLKNPSHFFSANPVPTFRRSDSTLAKTLTREPPRYDLQDKIALITNSSTGPSRALAIRLGAAGARVICVDFYPHAQPIWRSPFLKPGESPKFTDPHHFPTHDVIMAAGGVAIFLKTDVNDGKELEEAVRETVKRTVLGGIEKLETVLGKTITEDGKSLEHIKKIVGGLGRIDM